MAFLVPIHSRNAPGSSTNLSRVHEAHAPSKHALLYRSADAVQLTSHSPGRLVNLFFGQNVTVRQVGSSLGVQILISTTAGLKPLANQDVITNGI
eukprot:4088620-Amphidinium_carterae.1